MSDELSAVIHPMPDIQIKIEVPAPPTVSIIALPGIPGKDGTNGSDSVDYASQDEVKAGIVTNKVISPATLNTVLTYTHQQVNPSDIWTIVHNMGRYPNVTVTDSANTVVTGDIAYINVNVIHISFASAFSGMAYLG